MKAIISTTTDDRYLFFLPITAWCWNKLGVDVINFIPGPASKWINGSQGLVINTLIENKIKCTQFFFYCPENKEATYAQCARLYAAAIRRPDFAADWGENEIIITSDVDMALFRLPFLYKSAFTGEYDFPHLQVIGTDLVPNGQIPICYISARRRLWIKAMAIGDKTYQECLDELLGHEEMENMRGNLWSRDQETAFNKIYHADVVIKETGRARPGTQFATNRVDRDDANWRSYLGPDLVDAHLWRPGYTDENFANIMELLTTQYPNDSFEWLIYYRNEYIKLL